MELFELYLPSFAAIDSIPNPENYQTLVLEWIKNATFQNPDAWNCDVKSTFSTDLTSEKNILSLPLFRDLKKEIETSFSRFYAQAFNDTETIYEIEESWINIYEKGNFQESHAHSHSLFAGSYYVKAHKESGAIILEGIGGSEKSFVPQEGMLVFFEGEMPHHVEKNQSSEQRISLSFNIN